MTYGSVSLNSEWAVAVGASLLVAALLGLATWAWRRLARTPPDLDGLWRVHLVTEQTGYGRFENMELEYVVALLSEGTALTGHGEKDQERSVGMNGRCEGDDRVRIDLRGRVAVQFRRATVDVSIKEHGRKRASTSYHRVSLDTRTGKLRGTFRSTVGNQSGRSVWTRESLPA